MQFQSIIFETGDLKKLVDTLNKACGEDGLTAERLNKAFEVWYPTLEKELRKILDISPDEGDTKKVSQIQEPNEREILEEILELSRNNQKLIKNQEGSHEFNLQEMKDFLQTNLHRPERIRDSFAKRRHYIFHQKGMHEIIDVFSREGDRYTGAEVALSVFQDQYPWIYDLGIEAIKILKSRRSNKEKFRALEKFERIAEISFEHPAMQEVIGNNEELHYLCDHIHKSLLDSLNAEFTNIQIRSNRQ